MKIDTRRLKRLWSEWTQVGFDDAGKLTEPFKQFTIGTYSTVVHHWFETEFEGFSIGEAHTHGIEKAISMMRERLRKGRGR